MALSTFPLRSYRCRYARALLNASAGTAATKGVELFVPIENATYPAPMAMPSSGMITT